MHYPTPPIRNSKPYFPRVRKPSLETPSCIQQAFESVILKQDFPAAIRIVEKHGQELLPKQIQEAFRLATYFQNYDFLDTNLALTLLSTFDTFDFDPAVIQQTLENSLALIKYCASQRQTYEDSLNLFVKLLKTQNQRVGYVKRKFIREAFRLSLDLKANDLKYYLIRNFQKELDKEDIKTALLEALELTPSLYTDFGPVYSIKDEYLAEEIIKYCWKQIDAETIQKTFVQAILNDSTISKDLAISILDHCSGLISVPCAQMAFKRAAASNENMLALRILESVNPTLFCKNFINEAFKLACFSTHSQYSVAIHILRNEHTANKIHRSTIAAAYQDARDIQLIQAIQSYVRGPGRWRHIELPARPDIESEGQQLNEVAFDVHNYTDGLDELCLSHIKSLLIQYSIKTTPFSLLSLKSKITHLISNEQDRKAAFSALGKLRSDPYYFGKLKNVLPTLAAFLNTDSINWHESHLGYNERWTLWLQQSFVESGKAYKGDNDSTSCPRGAYERCFSGFRNMHDTFDAIFLPANLIRYYFPLADDGFDPKIKLLIEKDMLINIIRNMQAYIPAAEGMGDKANSYLTTHLKQICAMFLFEHISLEARKRLKEDYGHIPSELKETISEIFETKIGHVRTKMDLFLSTLEDVDLALGTDPHNPISFLEMIHRILYKIWDSKEDSFVESVIDSEIEQVKETIALNKETKPFRDLIQNELEQRQYIEMRQSRKFFELKDSAT